MKVYIAFSDNREHDHPRVLGVFERERDAYSCIGTYARKHNTVEELQNRWMTKSVVDMTDEELGNAALNQYSCIYGDVEEHELGFKN